VVAGRLAAAPQFLLSEENAAEIIVSQVECIEQNWPAVCEEASLTETDRNLLWGNQILNPYAFEELESGPLSGLARRHGRG
jgi:serine/threonine-protein kinase HipA